MRADLQSAGGPRASCHWCGVGAGPMQSSTFHIAKDKNIYFIFILFYSFRNGMYAYRCIIKFAYQLHEVTNPCHGRLLS